jgi:hypothetical protein
VTERAPQRSQALSHREDLLVRAGAVSWGGRGVLVTGPRGAGTSRLIAALVEAGGALVAGTHVAIDDAGQIHGMDDGVPGSPVPVDLIVSTAYDPDTVAWAPRERRGAQAALSRVEHIIEKQVNSRRLLRIAAGCAPGLVALSGPRPDAAVVAAQILVRLDALNAERATDAGVELLQRDRALLLLHWYGRFGNRMHQYAYGVTYARRNACVFVIPSDWEGTHLFAEQSHQVLPRGRLRTNLNRPHEGAAKDRLAGVQAVLPDAELIQVGSPRHNYRPRSATACVDSMCAYHPSIFTPMSRAELVRVFAFCDRVKRLDFYKRLEDRQGTYDIAHLRRDDISNPRYNRTHTQGYSVIAKASYDRAFARFGFDPSAVEWTSDDYTQQWHADRPVRPRGGWSYPEGSEVLPGVVFDWLEDFLRLYFARTIFRANSSFSWWAAFLSPTARVLSPVLDKRHIYGVDGMDEIDVEFVEGNHPHWMYGNADIIIGP